MEQFIKKNKNLIRVFIILLNLFLLALIILVGVSIVNSAKESRYIGQDNNKNTIEVSGQGTVYISPNIAKISFSVKTEAKTVKQAMAANINKMNDIINVLEQEGISKKDLKTTNFSVYPRYEWQKQTMPVPVGKRILVGYEVSQTLEVKIRNLDKIGKVIQLATKAGANQIGNLQFLVDNQEEFKKQARIKAIEQAKQKAKEIASELGIKLGRIVNFSESVNSPIYYPLRKNVSEITENNSIPQIEPGQNKIEIKVYLTYNIQ